MMIAAMEHLRIPESSVMATINGWLQPMSVEPLESLYTVPDGAEMMEMPIEEACRRIECGELFAVCMECHEDCEETVSERTSLVSA